MRKNIFGIVFLLFIFSFKITAQDAEVAYTNSKLKAFWEVSLRVLFPFYNEQTFFNEKTKMLLFFDFGIGVNYDLVQNIVSPGIYADVALGIDWILMFLNEEDEKYKPTQLEFGGGIRIYNVSRIFGFSIMPFIGYNALVSYGHLLPSLGLILKYEGLSIEYAFYIPNEFNKSRHHISLKLICDYYFDKNRKIFRKRDEY
jgi:hypothetical protein